LGYRTFIITDANLKKMTETKKIAEYLNFFKIKYIGLETSTGNQTEAKPSYSGPFSTKIEGAQSFVLIISKEEANQDALIGAIRQFNQNKYGQQSLVVSSSMLDDFRLMIKVDGISNPQSGLEYLRAIATDPQVYGPIQNANYRNFIITPENEAIFRQSKNIITYMDFYKQFYLK